MATAVPSEDWLKYFPALAGAEEEVARLLVRETRLATIPSGTWLFREGDLCHNYLLVIAGRVRVQKVAESGREIVLYRVEGGESCILTTSCLMAEEGYTAEAVAETDICAAILPDQLFHDLLGRSEVFRRFVFTAYARRMSRLLALIDEVAFRRVDLRLARFLLDHADIQHGVALTHQELASELGTAREVISRQMKEFARRGWVVSRRGRIKLTDVAALSELANNNRPLL